MPLLSYLVDYFHFTNFYPDLFFTTITIDICVAIFVFSIYSWFLDIIFEATYCGFHTMKVIQGLRYGMILFIASEIMFFFSFFWAFFHCSVSPSIWIGCIWPPAGIKTINPWGLPLFNTLILLSSGITVTYAHKALTAGSRVKQVLSKILYYKDDIYGIQKMFVSKPQLTYIYKEGRPLLHKNSAYNHVTIGLMLTLVYGILFTLIQCYEYINTNFTIADGIYGSIFFVTTGFHGVHVIIGTIFLGVCLFRHCLYHFTTEFNFGFEAAIWYWHFVDVVWLFLFISIYWWGGNY